MRIQIDLDEHGMGIVEDVRQLTGLTTYKDLFNNAITILDWAARQCHKGLEIAAVDEEKEQYRELQMPALQYAWKKGQSERESAQAKAVAGTRAKAIGD